jgi:hypothetical protein
MGRPLGSLNSLTLGQKANIEEFLMYSFPKMKPMWDKMVIDDPKFAMSFVKDLLVYTTPRRAPVDDKGNSMPEFTLNFIRELDTQVLENYKMVENAPQND